MAEIQNAVNSALTTAAIAGKGKQVIDEAKGLKQEVAGLKDELKLSNEELVAKYKLPAESANYANIADQVEAQRAKDSADSEKRDEIIKKAKDGKEISDEAELQNEGKTAPFSGIKAEEANNLAQSQSTNKEIQKTRIKSKFTGKKNKRYK